MYIYRLPFLDRLGEFSGGDDDYAIPHRGQRAFRYLNIVVLFGELSGEGDPSTLRSNLPAIWSLT